MPGLEHLVERILGDAEDEARRVEQAGREQAASIVAGYEGRAQAQKGRVLAMAAKEAEALKARLISAAELEARDRKLAAKQQLVDRVLAAALERLNGMDDVQYAAFLARQLAGAELPEGARIIVPQRRRGRLDLSAVNPALRFSDSGRAIDGGFVLTSPDTESNNTFEALIGYRRGELEALIVGLLLD